MALYVGSARIDENGNATGGKAGDQKQTTAPDYKGEVAQERFYVHSLGWYVIRPITVSNAVKIASVMINACNNKNIGYNQSDRNGVIKYGTSSEVPTACDCSTLVRACVKEATGYDCGNITTYSERAALLKMVDAGGNKLFEDIGAYVNGKTALYDGDILVTKKKGHTVIVTSGSARMDAVDKYYPKYTGSTVSIVTALRAVGETDTSYTHRSRIASASGIDDYKGSAAQNKQMISLLKAGKLVRV